MDERSPQKDFCEIEYLAAESANKLHVLYLFEDQICLTDSFNDTMRMIDENDGAWKTYIEFIDSHPEIDDDPLSSMAIALVHMHVSRLEIAYEQEDLRLTIAMVYSYLKIMWEEEIKDWIHNRHTWLRIFDENS